MAILGRLYKAIANPYLLALYILGKLAPYIQNDRIYIQLKYKFSLNISCNLDNPVTFQEKLQWIKLHDHKPVYHQMVDKVGVKEFIAEKIGREYVVPTIGVWENLEDINFSLLPKEFIIKNTNDSGTYYICTNKDELDYDELKRRLSVTWGHDYYVWSREWCYKGLKRRIIVEPLLHDGKGLYLTDYKFFTFNGEPKFFYTTSGRGTLGGLKEDFFDIEGNHMEFSQAGYLNRGSEYPKPPVNLSKMIEFSRILAKDTYHLRVDFYEISGKLYVGELTFFDGGGFCNFVPLKYNRILGDLIDLPKI